MHNRLPPISPAETGFPAPALITPEAVIELELVSPPTVSVPDFDCAVAVVFNGADIFPPGAVTVASLNTASENCRDKPIIAPIIATSRIFLFGIFFITLKEINY
jgi:predicted ribosome-associated RNA-binding protein Tma20